MSSFAQAEKITLSSNKHGDVLKIKAKISSSME